LFVSDELGSTVSVFSTTSDTRLATIALGSEVGNTQYDPVARRILAAGQGRDDLVAIDPVANQVAGRSALPRCKHAHGLALDAPNRFAFVACDANATVLVVDLRTLQVTGTQTVSDRRDVLVSDPGLCRLDVAAARGELAIFEERRAKLTKVVQGPIAASAHCMAVDPQTHRLYFPLERSADHPVLRIFASVAGGGP